MERKWEKIRKKIITFSFLLLLFLICFLGVFLSQDAYKVYRQLSTECWLSLDLFCLFIWRRNRRRKCVWVCIFKSITTSSWWYAVSSFISISTDTFSQAFSLSQPTRYNKIVLVSFEIFFCLFGIRLQSKTN